MVRSWAAGYVAPLWMAVALAAPAAWAGEPVLLADVNGNPEADEPRWLDTLDDRALLWTVVRAPGEAGLQRLVGVDLADGRVTTLVDGERAPRWSERVGDRLFFGTDEALWVTDGTAQGTSLAVAATAQPGAAVGDRVLFWWLLDGERRELWSTDGTPMGTERLVAPTEGVVLGRTAVLDGKLAFTTTGCELWETDGTTAGTRALLTPVEAQGGRALPCEAAPGPGGEIIIHAFASAWLTDGTPGGTRPADYLAGSHHTLVGGGVLFRRDEPQGLWFSDGTLDGTRRLAEGRVDAIARLADRAVVVLADEVIGVSGDEVERLPIPVGSSQVVVSGDEARAYVVSFTDGQRSITLTDGTATGTRAVAAGGEPAATVHGARMIAPTRTGLVALALDARGHPVVTWDDGEGSQVAWVGWDGVRTESSLPHAWQTVGDQAVFLAFSATVPVPELWLWVTDGTPAGTRRLLPGVRPVATLGDRTLLLASGYAETFALHTITDLDPATSQPVVDARPSLGPASHATGTVAVHHGGRTIVVDEVRTVDTTGSSPVVATLRVRLAELQGGELREVGGFAGDHDFGLRDLWVDESGVVTVVHGRECDRRLFDMEGHDLGVVPRPADLDLCPRGPATPLAAGVALQPVWGGLALVGPGEETRLLVPGADVAFAAASGGAVVMARAPEAEAWSTWDVDANGHAVRRDGALIRVGATPIAVGDDLVFGSLSDQRDQQIMAVRRGLGARAITTGPVVVVGSFGALPGHLLLAHLDPVFGVEPYAIALDDMGAGDTGAGDERAAAGGGGGCDCQVRPDPPGPPGALALLLLAVGRARRRRRA